MKNKTKLFIAACVFGLLSMAFGYAGAFLNDFRNPPFRDVVGITYAFSYGFFVMFLSHFLKSQMED